MLFQPLFKRSPFMRTLLVVIIASVCILATTFTLAADPVQRSEVEVVEGLNKSELTIAESEAQDLLRDLTIQRNAEIETEMTTSRLAVEQLQEQLADTSSPSEQLALHRATEATKVASEIAVMNIQARYADLAGKPELATQMREEADRMEQIATDRNQAYRQ